MQFDLFESRVISDGSQTRHEKRKHRIQFESRVISDGSQTRKFRDDFWELFESRVISDGSQTRSPCRLVHARLRVV